MAPDELRERLRLAGIVTREQLLASGTSRTQIETSVAHGSLVRISRGVYVRAEVADKYLRLQDGERLLRTIAALAVSGPGAVISHQSAALLHPGFPLTTAARTVIDLARELDFRSGVVAADSALHRKLTTKDELCSVLAACAQWRGVRRAAEVVEFADKRAESPLESIARVVFRDCGLPPPDLQVWLGGVVEPVGRVDFYWKRYRTVAEVDGDLKYKDPARAKAQLKRDALLRADGYEVVHFDWQEVTGSPDYVATRVRDAFRRGLRTARPAS